MMRYNVTYYNLIAVILYNYAAHLQQSERNHTMHNVTQQSVLCCVIVVLYMIIAQEQTAVYLLSCIIAASSV